MKLLAALMMLVSLSAFAQGGGGGDRVGGGQIIAPLYELILPGSPMMRNPQSKTITIFVNGSVVKEVSALNEQNEVMTTAVEIGKVSDMSALNQCATELKGQRPEHPVYPGCADDGGVRYKLASEKSSFAERSCGKLFTARALCAKTMVSILDGFSKVSP